MPEVSLRHPSNQPDRNAFRGRISGDTLARCILAGVSYGLSFPPFNLTGFAFLALAVLFTEVAQERERPFLPALAFWGPAWALPFSWVTLHQLPLAGIVSGIALLGLIFLAAAASIGFGCLGSLGPRSRIMASATGILLLDLLLLYGPVPMPWVLTGFTQAGSVWTSALSAHTGTSGLGILVLTLSVAIAVSAGRFGPRAWAVSLVGALFLSLAPSPLSDTAFRLYPLSATDGRPDVLTIHVYQPGSAPRNWADLDAPDRNAHILTTPSSPMAGIDLMLLPETALVTDAGLADSSRAWSVPILSGAILQRDEGFVNAALLAHPDGRIARYEKEILVPFAERTPLSGIFPFMNRFAVSSGGVRTYEAGFRSDAMIVQGNRIQTLICFESLFPRLLRPEADVLVVLTQDGWWDSSRARSQHFLYSRMLALQAGIPLVQASVDGLSGAVAADGRVVALAAAETSARLTVTLPLDHRSTGYRVVNDWPALTVLIISVFFLSVRSFSTTAIRTE